MKNHLFLLSFLFIFTFLSNNIKAQNIDLISGFVVNQGKPIDMVNVAIKGTSIGVQTNKTGYFELKYNFKKNIILNFSCITYKSKEIVISKDMSLPIKIELELSDQQISEVEVNVRTQRTDNLIKIDPKIIHSLPDVNGGIEGLVKTQLGVKSNNELSSQYNVRGGSFDENLVYVNDIEIYRPFLVRSGQQEGLSFVNPDMVSSVYFSAGGFAAKYGDKMASVLDVSYRQPTQISTSFTASLLGASLQTEGVLAKGKLTYNIGYRYKTSKYLLNSLETTGDYSPTFMDIQSLISYQISKKSSISLLSNYSANVFDFIPKNQRTTFGTLNTILDLIVVFNGHERDNYSTITNAVSFNYNPSIETNLKFIGSVYHSSEVERFDIEGRYSLNSLSRLDGQNVGDSSLALGIGSFLNHANNSLTANVYNLQHKGSYKTDAGIFNWGLQAQNEIINSQTNEWKIIDSAGYSLPNLKDGLQLSYSFDGSFNINTIRYSAFVDHTQAFYISKTKYTLNLGLRAAHSNQNKEYLISPRVGIAIKPNWEKDWLFRLSAGLYFQAPFYKEFQFLENRLQSNVKSNQSIHFIAGGDYYFKAWGRPFKLIFEAFYKQIDIIPYQIDNLRIKYQSEKRANGYVSGLDLKLNGEFVKGAESWFSMSLMQSRQIINGTSLEIPLPTDQLFNAGLFFQDYFPGNETFKINLMLLYGSPLPFGPPDQMGDYKNFRMSSYNRVDIGFTKEFISAQKPKLTGYFKIFKELSITGEIFNIFAINNTVSYLWLTVVPPNNSTQKPEFHQLAVPNRLTARRLNFKLIARF